MRKLVCMLFAAFGLSLAAASPSFAYDQNLGGVNLTAWCVGAYVNLINCPPRLRDRVEWVDRHALWQDSNPTEACFLAKD